MKKFLCVTISLLMTASLTAYGSKDEGKRDDGKASESKADIVMITDVNTVNGKSFNQGIWEGVKVYGEETGEEVEHIKPTEKPDNACKEAIDQAVDKYKAKVTVTPGYLFEPSIYEEQDIYPDVKFILIDGYPDGDTQENAKFKITKNTVSIKYSENEAGYMAGYAIVKEDKTRFGFMGGVAVPAIINFGYGFVQGAQDVTREMNVGIETKYKYTGTFNPSVGIQSEAAPWYKSGARVIFSCGGGIGNSVMAAAEANRGLVIDADVDQPSESSTVITSVYKQLAIFVTKGLKAIDDGTFPGGENTVLGAKDDPVGLPMETSRFGKFTQEEYNALYAKIKEGRITIKIDEDFKDPTQIKASKVKLDYIK